MMYTSRITALGLAAALAAPATAFFRIPCPGRIVTERADPIVDPGAVSGHVHSIAGGNGFGFNMTYEQARTSTCSSCPITQDLSNYWTPSLYYQFENGSFESVAQVGDGTGVFAGQNVYYLQRPGPDDDTLYAFPEGFRMLAGDPFKRNSTDDFASEAVSFVCLDYSGTSSTSSGFPTINCPDGLRAQIFFPSCWNGVDLDSADHKSHMAYPESGSYDNGPCPASHPVHLISIFYEVLWDTGAYVDMWYGDGQPFVFSMGDPTGYGMHGDFVNGWNVTVLQEAVDTCNNDSGLITDCAVFEFFTDAESQACIIPTQVDEQVYGYLDTLPGCNPVQDGPEEATSEACTAGVIGPFKEYFTDVTTSLGWEYIGCGSDSSTRTLSGSDWLSDSVDVETCIDYCDGKGYTIAGMEYSSQCYCGDSVAADRAPVAHILGNCFATCAGNSSEYCGGSDALSLYQKCTSASNCTNVLYTPPYADGDDDETTITSTTASTGYNATSSTSSSATGATSGSSASSGSSATSVSSASSGSSATSVSSASSGSSATSVSSAASGSATSASSAAVSSGSSTLSTVTSSGSTTSSTGFSSAQKAHMKAAEQEHKRAEEEAAAVKATLAEYERDHDE